MPEGAKKAGAVDRAPGARARAVAADAASRMAAAARLEEPGDEAWRRAMFGGARLRRGTLEGYVAGARDFCDWMERRGPAARGRAEASVEGMDLALADFICHLYLKADVAGQRGAAVTAKCAVAHLLGVKGRVLPGATQALEAWEKGHPGRSPSPLTVAMMAAVAAELRRAWGVRAGCLIVVQFFGLLRASELLGLRTDLVALPGDARLGAGDDGGTAAVYVDMAKTGSTQMAEIDDALGIDALTWLVAHPVYDDEGTPRATLWSYSQWAYRFGLAVKAAGLGNVGLTTHSCRHGGALWLWQGRKMGPLKIMIRGRWSCESSLVHYLQLARAGLLTYQLPAELQTILAGYTADPGLALGLAWRVGER
jgi:integrase